MPVTRVPEDLSNVDEDRLYEIWNSVAEEALERKEASRRIAHEIDRRNIEKATRERFAGMSEREREAFVALAQSVEPEGVDTEESVGEQEDEGEQE